jgi:hypothetical protein
VVRYTDSSGTEVDNDGEGEEVDGDGDDDEEQANVDSDVWWHFIVRTMNL